MIFITLGSQKFQFNRLLKAVDDLIKKNGIEEEVFAQIGYSDYIPKNYKYTQFLGRDEFAETIKKSDIVITHGGTGVIIGAVKQEKKVIAVPRLAEYGEHVDDHQKQIIGQFDNLGLIFKCEDCADLESLLKQIRQTQFKEYKSNTQTIIDSIERFISEI